MSFSVFVQTMPRNYVAEVKVRWSRAIDHSEAISVMISFKREVSSRIVSRLPFLILTFRRLLEMFSMNH